MPLAAKCVQYIDLIHILRSANPAS